MGESPNRVFNVGALGLENIRNTPIITQKALSESIQFNLDRPYFLVTFHPVTLENRTAGKQFQALLDAMENFLDYKVIFTKTNADTDGRIINQMIDNFVDVHADSSMGFTSLGRLRYLSALKYADSVIGNSSSGIIEAPNFKVPTVNIGDRQKGRVQARSVINCSPTRDEIVKSIQQAISDDFSRSIQDMTNPYEKMGTAKKIQEIIKGADLKNISKKSFYDIVVGDGSGAGPSS